MSSPATRTHFLSLCGNKCVRAGRSGAGALAEPALRALDAIHIVSAVDLGPIEAFVTYDERQAAVARLAGLRTIAPGA